MHSIHRQQVVYMRHYTNQFPKHNLLSLMLSLVEQNYCKDKMFYWNMEQQCLTARVAIYITHSRCSYSRCCNRIRCTPSKSYITTTCSGCNCTRRICWSKSSCHRFILRTKCCSTTFEPTQLQVYELVPFTLLELVPELQL